MKERKEIQRSPEDYQIEASKRDLAAKGVVSGTAASLLGAGIYGMSKNLEKKIKSGNFDLIKGSEKDIIDDIITSKRVGKTLMAVGIPVAGIAAYKHFKYKKKDDNKA